MKHGHRGELVMDHYDRHSILSDKQPGFRSKRSCETQLSVTMDSIALTLADGGQVDIIILDFSKAFDTVALKMGLNSRQSSAKRRASEMVTSGRSLMKVKKSSGPRTVSCGAPDNTSAVNVPVRPSYQSPLTASHVP
jgi:hypothetical protein